jgi:hypothetical protein
VCPLNCLIVAYLSLCSLGLGEAYRFGSIQGYWQESFGVGGGKVLAFGGPSDRPLTDERTRDRLSTQILEAQAGYRATIRGIPVVSCASRGEKVATEINRTIPQDALR